MIQKALFGAGCFWGVEEHFKKINGVIKTEVGYSGGHTENPTYETVCSHNTGHAEVLKVDFDAKIISYKTLLEEFWQCHDPTTHNRQGPDVGHQYRSVIYYFNEEQKTIAENSKNTNQHKFNNRIVTEISEANVFHRAEEYHQNYIEKSKY